MAFTGEGIDHLTLRAAGGSETEMPLVNKFMIDPNKVTLEFKGNHSTFRKFVPDGISGTLAMDKLDLDMFDLLGMTEVTAGLPAGYASGFYPELATLPFLETNAYAFMTDDSTGTDTLHAIRVFKTKYQLFVPAELGNIAVQTNEFEWSGQSTLTDIDDAALPDIGSVPVIYRYDVAA